LEQEWSVVVLGAEHDLSDNADRLSGGTAEVVEVSIRDAGE
jgi:hypothetical protein